MAVLNSLGAIGAQEAATEGNDSIYGYAGDDLIDGGAGNDYLSGGAGNDTIYGGPGDDAIDGGYGNNLLFGGEGNDSLEGSGTLDGGAGDDTLDGIGLFRGGAGNDLLNINPYSTNSVDNYLAGGHGSDTINLWFCNQSKFTFRRSGDDLLMDQVSSLSSGRTTFSKWYLGSDYQVEQFRFSSSTLSAEDITGLADDSRLIYGTDAADILTVATIGGESIFGYAGNDLICGAEGNDQLFGGDGADSLFGSSGNDLLDGGDGDDVLVIGGAGAYYAAPVW